MLHLVTALTCMAASPAPTALAPAAAAPAPTAAAAAPLTYPALKHEKITLPENGLEVIFYEDHRLPIVAVNVWYHAGPVNEEPGRTGFAHLFEHLMFQGSKHVGDDQHLKRLESIGASQINGTTNYDRTNYFETVPSNQLATALWLESDRMGFLLESLTADKLQNQREVVKNERRQSFENRPYGPSDEKEVQTLFPAGHPYYGVVIGSMADLDAASLDDVKAFYTRYYAPANATLVIAGDFVPADAKALVQKYFASLARRPAPEKRAVVTPPVEAQRRVEVPEPVMLPRLEISWLSPVAYSEGDAHADALSYLLGGGDSSRLYRKLVYELQLAQAASAGQDSRGVASTFTVSVLARPGVDIKKLEAETWKILEAARAAPPTAPELTRVKNLLITGNLGSLQDVGLVADRLNNYNQEMGEPDGLAKDLGRYDAITPESLHAFAKDLLDPERCAVVTTLPTLPPEPAVPAAAPTSPAPGKKAGKGKGGK